MKTVWTGCSANRLIAQTESYFQYNIDPIFEYNFICTNNNNNIE